jgi:hypothetical protein
LQNREPADLLEEVRSYARRKPGTFLLGAALAGVVAGRLTSGIKASHTGGSGALISGSSGGSNGQSGSGYSSNYAIDQGSTYTGYAETTGYPTTGYTQGSGYAPEYGQGGTYETPGTGAPLPPPPYGTVPPEGSVVPPTTPAGWDDPARRSGEGV